MLRTIQAVTATIFLAGHAVPVAAEPIIRAVLVDGNAYVSPLLNIRSGEPNWEETGGNFTLLSQPLNAPQGLQVKLKLTDVVEAQTNMSILHRWQVDKDRVHFLSYHPFGDAAFNIVSYPLDIVINLGKASTSIKETADRKQKFDQTRISVHSPMLIRTVSRSLNSWNAGFVVYDILPVAQNQYECYVSAPEDGQNRITRLISSRTKKDVRIEWSEDGVWSAKFGSRFYSTSNGDDRFFINEEGNVYFAPREAKPAKAGKPLKELWLDWKIKPVNALIHDVDNAKWYAFTKDQYFEVKDPIKPLSHKLNIVRADKATEALEIAAKCGRVIRGLPEPKVK